MNIEQLEAFGFKEYPIHKDLDRHDRNWQYCVRDEEGKKLFVQVRLWRFSKFSSLSREVEDTFDAWCQLDKGHPWTYDVELLSVDHMTPEEVVRWFEDMHTRMGCTYYELWDE